MILMALPSMFGPVASVVAAVLALVAGVAWHRPNVERPYDCEREIADLTLKVRRPWAYRVRKWMGE